MNSKNYIVIIILSLVLAVKGLYAQQNLETACANATEWYKIKPLPGSTVAWNVSGGKIINDKNDSIQVLWNNSSGIYSISYIETNEFLCQSEEYTANIIINKPSVDLGQDKAICGGTSLTLDAGNFTTYRWNDGSIKQTFDVSKAGKYYVDVTDEAGCLASDTFLVSVNTAPTVKLQDGVIICAPENYLYNPTVSNSVTNYLWFNGSTGSTYLAEEGDSIIWVRVTDNIGCASYDSTLVLSCDISTKIPNAFTPNGDDDNEVFRLDQVRAIYPSLVVKIYDRWGRLVFISDKGYSSPWDGTSNGKKLPMDTYYYVINLGNGAKEVVGSVAIIR